MGGECADEDRKRLDEEFQEAYTRSTNFSCLLSGVRRLQLPPHVRSEEKQELSRGLKRSTLSVLQLLLFLR